MPIPVEIPISKYFDKDTIAEISKTVERRVESLLRGLREIREEKLVNWRKIYDGTPREKSKSFPWQGASNVVPQLVGSFVDQLTARIVMDIFAVHPLANVELVGDFEREEHGEEQRQAIEAFLNLAGSEPKYLNLLPKTTSHVRTFVKYGMGAMKIIPEQRVEQVAAGIVGGKVDWETYVRHDGPVAIPLRFEDFMIPPTLEEMERMPIVCQRAVITRFDIEALKWDKSYDQAILKEIIAKPDRSGPDRPQREQEQETGAKKEGEGKDNAEWDFYEAWLPWIKSGKRFHLIVTYHHNTKKVLKAVFNWLPENKIPYQISRLGTDGEKSYGLGFCDMLKDYQEEVAAIHNQRRDASTLANTNIMRIGEGTQMDSQFSFYPNAMIVAPEKGIEVIPLGRTAGETIKDEQMVLGEATDRAGVGPSSSGSGSGTVTKKGAYSAMGTFAEKQEGNTRANLNVTEYKTSHINIMRTALLYYAHFGLTTQELESLGKMGKWLKQGLMSYKEGRLTLPIRPSTGSVNREVEKQNLMLLLNNMRAHMQMTIGMLQQTQNPMMPPIVSEYTRQWRLASNLLMKDICIKFGLQDTSAYLPEPVGIDLKASQLHGQISQQQQQEVQQQQAPQLQAPQNTPPPNGAVPPSAPPSSQEPPVQ